MDFNKIFNEDVITGLDKLDAKSIQCCVTSPPYYGLRDYKLPPTKWPEINFSILGFPVTVKEQECCLGLEKTPMEFVGHIVLIFRKVKEALRDDGTLWMNLGDSYAGSWANYGGQNRSAGKQRQIVSGSRVPNEAWENKTDFLPPGAKGFDNIKSKDLMGVPWMVAYALRDDGWYLRSDIIWHKPNPMPESVTDRPTKSHEDIFLLAKSQKYYYDAESIAEPFADSSLERLRQDIANQKGSNRVPGKTNGPMKAVGLNTNRSSYKAGSSSSMNNGEHISKSNEGLPVKECGRNKRDVWTVTTKSFNEAHFATFPEDLIIDCIKAGSPTNALILDPFMGAGTTALVARKLNRNYIGFELNPEYIKIAEKRLHSELGMFV